MATSSVSVSAVPFNPNTQTFGSTPTPVQNTQPMQSNVPVQQGVPTAAQNLAAYQAQQAKLVPQNIPQSQSIATFGTQQLQLPYGQPSNTQNTVYPPYVQPNQAQSILAQTQVEDTQNQKNADSLSNNIASLYGGLAGQGQMLGQKQEELGLNKFKSQLNDLNAQILQKTAELNQDDVKLVQSLTNVEKQAIPMGFITGQQQSVQRDAQIARALKSSEIGVLNAVAIGTQGNIALAQEMAQSAVDQKYAPIKEAIQIMEGQLKAIQPLLDRDEKKQAREQEIKTQLALKDIEAREATEKSINSMITSAIQYAPPSVISNAMALKNQGASELEIARSLGEYGGDYLKNQLLKAQLTTEKAQQAKIYSDINNSGGGGAGGGVAVTSTTDINPLKFKDATARTLWQTTGGVIQAVDDMETGAKADGGNYAGLGYFQGGAPDVLVSAEGTKNRAFINGVNLKVQQWASGASLTAEQIKMVNKMVPQQQDADSVIKKKLDGLKAYMQNEQKSIANSQGQKIVTTDEVNNLYADKVDMAYGKVIEQTKSVPSSTSVYSSFYNSLYAK